MARPKQASEWARSALLALGLALLQFSPRAAEPPSPASVHSALPRVVVPKLGGPVKLDGELDEAVWGRAALLQPFVRNDGRGPAREATQLRLWYDDQALYLGWTCQDTNIQATFTRRDSPLFEEDAVEFFVATNELTRYFEFEWNPLGTIFDAVIQNRLRSDRTSRFFTGNSAYTATNLQAAVKVKGQLNHTASADEGWQMEIRLPFSDLGVPPPRPKDTWRINAFRVNHTRGLKTELLSWSPTLTRSFHEPGRFGVLEFGEPDRALVPAKRSP